MKLQIIDNTKRRNTPVRLSFTKTGNLSLSSAASEKYNLNVGDKIAILQDQEAPDDFYLVKTDDPKSVILRKSSGVTLLVGYANAYDKIRNHFGLEKKSFSMGLGGMIKTEFGSAIVMITAALKKSE